MLFSKLEPTLREHPDWRKPLSELEQAAELTRSENILDPGSLSDSSGLSLPVVLALLHLVGESGVGELVFRVLDSKGLEVASYDKESQIPAVVENEFGDEIEVGPENTDFVFRLAAG